MSNNTNNTSNNNTSNNKPKQQQPTNQQPAQTQAPTENTKVQDTTSTTTETPVEATTVQTTTTKTETPEVQTTINTEVPVVTRNNNVGVTAGTLNVVSKEPTVNELSNNLAALKFNLEGFEERLSRRTASPVDEVAKQMNGLYSLLVNTINANKSIREFTAEWSFICEFFKKHQNEGLSVARLYRGVTMWPRSQDDYLHFQSLINLIYVTNNEDRKNLEKQVNLNKVTKGLTEGGRGRLLSFYL